MNICSSSALQIKHLLDNSKMEIRRGSRIVRIDAVNNPIPLHFFSKRLLELSKTLPLQETDLKNRAVALHALERLRIHYKWSDALLEASCFSRLLHQCKKCFRKETIMHDIEIAQRRLRGFNEEHFSKLFPGRDRPRDIYCDSQVGMLYLLTQEEITALVQPKDSSKPKKPPSKKSQGWRLFKKLSR